MIYRPTSRKQGSLKINYKQVTRNFLCSLANACAGTAAVDHLLEILQVRPTNLAEPDRPPVKEIVGLPAILGKDSSQFSAENGAAVFASMGSADGEVSCECPRSRPEPVFRSLLLSACSIDI